MSSKVIYNKVNLLILQDSIFKKTTFHAACRIIVIA